MGAVGHGQRGGATLLNDRLGVAQVGRGLGDLAAVALNDFLELADARPMERNLVLARGNARAGSRELRVGVAGALLKVHELALEPRPLLVQLGQGAGPCRALVLERLDRLLVGRQRRHLLVVLAEGVREPQFLQALRVLEVIACLARLVLDAAQAALDLAKDVAEAQEVLLGALELAFGLAALGLVLGDAGGLFEDHAPFLRVGLQEDVDLALLDKAVGIEADAGIHEELADVAQAAGLAVEEILRLAAAVQAPADFDLGGVDGQQAAGIIERERGFGKAEAASRLAAGEDDVGHLAAAQAAGALLAEDPLDGVDDVRLAATVRTDDDGHARIELEPGPVGERFESEDFEFLKFQSGRTPCREHAGRAGA